MGFLMWQRRLYLCEECTAKIPSRTPQKDTVSVFVWAQEKFAQTVAFSFMQQNKAAEAAFQRRSHALWNRSTANGSQRHKCFEKNQKKGKTLLTKIKKGGNIDKLSLESRQTFLSQPRGSGSAGMKKFEKSLKMFLTRRIQFDIIIKLSQNSRH